MMKELSVIVGDLISQIDNSVQGKYDASSDRTYICDTKWMRVGKIVTDSSDREYRITEVVDDEYCTSKPKVSSSPPLDGKIYLPAPFYISGTKLATNREWTLSTNDLREKTPLAWLLEIIRISKLGRGESVDFESEIRLFFLDETDVRNYYTKDHRMNVVYPMERLAQQFIETIEKDRSFETLESYDLTTFSRFGMEDEKGIFENILDANLSGVELRVNLRKYKINCKC